MVGISSDETVKFEKVIKGVPHVFLIKLLQTRDKFKYLGGAIDDSGKPDFRRIQDKAVEIILASIISINGIPVTEQMLDSYRLDVIYELLGKIIEHNLITEEETKNS